MHGLIHAELEKFVETNYGQEAWRAILEEAGLEDRAYVPLGAYPDEESLAIVRAAAKLTETPAEAILEDFGEFIAPDLMATYKSLIRPEWKTLDFLLNTEETIHRVVRRQNQGAEPPHLKFEEAGPGTLRLLYDSPRRMSAVARGIIKGVAKHYGESVSLEESKKADGSSEITVRVT